MAQLPAVLPFTPSGLQRTGNSFSLRKAQEHAFTGSTAQSVSPGLLVTWTRSHHPPGTFWSRVAPGEPRARERGKLGRRRRIQKLREEMPSSVAVDGCAKSLRVGEKAKIVTEGEHMCVQRGRRTHC